VVHRRYLSECRDWRRCFTNLVDETTVWPWTAGADPLRLLAIRAADGFAGAVGYLVKPPHHGYSVWQDRSGRFHHRGEALVLKRHHRLFTHLLPYDYPDLTLSWGGRGGVAHGAGGCRSAFPLSPAVIGLLALAGGWERRQHWFVAPH
jgi:hypothetical protein